MEKRKVAIKEHKAVIQEEKLRVLADKAHMKKMDQEYKVMFTSPACLSPNCNIMSG